MRAQDRANALVKYDAASRALDAAVRVDEVKKIHDLAMAATLYAKQAQDGRLIAKAVELRRRAERRLGEVMQEQRKAGRLAKPPNPKRRVAKKPDDPPTLKDQGVGKALADRARKAAAMPAGEFARQVAKTVQVAVAATEGNREIIRAARAEQLATKRARRQERECQLGTKIMALPEKRFGVIVADPEWRFEPWSRATGLDRAADNHYPTSALQVIKERDVASIAAKDCVLFLWATAPMLPHAILVMSAWGFDYKAQVIWRKQRSGKGRGTGYWFINEHELLLVGVGAHSNIPAPAPGKQWPSVIDAPVGEHSAKPECFLEMIEEYFPNLPKIELNRRGAPRPGWKAWGREVESDAGNDDDTAQASVDTRKKAAAS